MQKKKKTNLNKNKMSKEYKLNLSAFQSRSSHLFSIHLRTQHLKSFLIVKGILKTFFQLRTYWRSCVSEITISLTMGSQLPELYFMYPYPCLCTPTTWLVLYVPVPVSVYLNYLNCTSCTHIRVCLPQLPELYCMSPVSVYVYPNYLNCT